ncbi:zinc finger protein 32-like isoform X1 [Achroia grisella]|uniref:zinc finger protein 32-like isoform X1 n=1 Tax=Achroia grisella TaxID=688607 RepID=UPI0027D20EAF|nr:zinc finger protein 32-like isoform X1 [Achroia grisella]
MLALLLLNNITMKRRNASRQKPVKPARNEKKMPVMVHCRTCLSTQDLVSIFINKDTEKKRTEDLKVVTGLNIKMDDGLSQKMCAKCIEIMNTALQFRRICRKSEKALLNMLSGRKSKRKYNTRLQKRVLKRTKLTNTKMEVKNEEFDCGFYDNDFQNDDCHNHYDDYENAVVNNDFNDLVKKDVKPKFKQKQTPGPKKRCMIPNAASYKCSTCNKEFRMKATFKAHMRFHTNYCVCESCGKRCRNNNQLQEHKRARHGLGRIHKCAYCEYSSATKEALTIHERRHTGERPYVCDHCGATFHRRSNLVQHIAIHLPEKNFQCDMCPKRLKSRKFLQIHKHNAHTGRRYGYLCAVCDHRFEKPNKVRAHARRVHGLPDDQQGPIVRVQL